MTSCGGGGRLAKAAARPGSLGAEPALEGAAGRATHPNFPVNDDAESVAGSAGRRSLTEKSGWVRIGRSIEGWLRRSETATSRGRAFVTPLIMVCNPYDEECFSRDANEETAAV